MSALEREASELRADVAASKLAAGIGMEARRQRVLKVLETNPSFRYAVVTDTSAEPGTVVVHIGIRDVGSGEIVMEKARYDGLAMLAMLERFAANAAVH
jgi:hypothetical protein